MSKPTKTIGLLCSVGLALGAAPLSDSADKSGEALLIVFPDYPVNTDEFGQTEKVGHAGVLLIDQSGLTKYYEFGRYSGSGERGLIRKMPKLSNVKIENGLATHASLAKSLAEISAWSGKDGRIRAAYFVNMDFAKMNDFAEAQTGEKRTHPDYSPTTNNCGHFAEAVILKGNDNVDRPVILNFLPNNVVDEYIEEGNAEVKFSMPDKLEVGRGDEADAKKKQ